MLPLRDHRGITRVPFRTAGADSRAGVGAPGSSAGLRGSRWHNWCDGRAAATGSPPSRSSGGWPGGAAPGRARRSRPGRARRTRHGRRRSRQTWRRPGTAGPSGGPGGGPPPAGTRRSCASRGPCRGHHGGGLRRLLPAPAELRRRRQSTRLVDSRSLLDASPTRRHTPSMARDHSDRASTQSVTPSVNALRSLCR